MGKTEQALMREQRLAAKLRENLKRRKEQARARVSGREAGPEFEVSKTVPDKTP